MPADSQSDNFDRFHIEPQLLRERAFNLRWATVDPDVIPLTAADPDFPVAHEIRQAIAAHAAEGVLGYGPTEGFDGFRAAVARMLSSRSVSARPDQILATDGAASALWAACRAVLGPGDEALTFDPIDFLLPHCSEQAGATVVRCPLERGTWVIAEGALEQRITEHTRAILLCNPHNPTGRVLRVDELRRIGDLAIAHDLVIINDEVWADIILGDVEMTSIASLSPEIAERTIPSRGSPRVMVWPGCASASSIPAVSRCAVECLKHQEPREPPSVPRYSPRWRPRRRWSIAIHGWRDSSITCGRCGPWR